MQTTNFVQKSFLLTFPKNSLTRSELLRSPKKKQACQSQETVERERSSVMDKVLTTRFAQK